MSLAVLGVLFITLGVWSHGSSQTSSAVGTTSTTAAVAATTTSPSLDLTSEIAALSIAPPTSNAGYSRQLFPHWIDADHNGCDTRCEVLARQKRFDLAGLPSGGWLSAYDGYTTSDASELDIDHVVPLAEAWVSGAEQWDSAMREAFANDLTSPELMAVTAATNRSKGDQDPANWQPPNRMDWCDYVRAWVTIKLTWKLTADPPEVEALRNMARDCS